jgi:heme/copper-type cytochrome/quinol oxidase subunit 2
MIGKEYRIPANPRTRLFLGAGIGLAAIASTVLLLVLNARGSDQKPLTVDVFARRYSWSFAYPSEHNAFSMGELRVPLDRQVRFRIYSQDFLHAFWVPEWRIQVDAPVGVGAFASVTPDRAGTFQVICAAFCGIGHSYMRGKVVAEPAADFRRWVSGLNRTVPSHLLEVARLDTELESIRRDREARG